jgi:hypothetical protein
VSWSELLMAPQHELGSSLARSVADLARLWLVTFSVLFLFRKLGIADVCASWKGVLAVLSLSRWPLLTMAIPLVWSGHSIFLVCVQIMSSLSYVTAIRACTRSLIPSLLGAACALGVDTLLSKSLRPNVHSEVV